MTKRAKAIRGFVIELQTLALDGTPLRMALQGHSTTCTAQEAEERLHQSTLNLQAYLVDMLENNEEQAEALMKELGVRWNKPPQ